MPSKTLDITNQDGDEVTVTIYYDEVDELYETGYHANEITSWECYGPEPEWLTESMLDVALNISLCYGGNY